MSRHPKLQLHRKVWRMTTDAPQGRWVDLDAKPVEQGQPEERVEPGWRQ